MKFPLIALILVLVGCSAMEPAPIPPAETKKVAEEEIPECAIPTPLLGVPNCKRPGDYR